MSVFVGNLSFSATNDDLLDEFEKFGTVSQAKVILDRETGDSRGFAFVTFENQRDAEDAISGADGIEIKGKQITCTQARPRTERGGFRGSPREYRRSPRGSPRGFRGSRGSRGSPREFRTSPREFRDNPREYSDSAYSDSPRGSHRSPRGFRGNSRRSFDDESPRGFRGSTRGYGREPARESERSPRGYGQDDGYGSRRDNSDDRREYRGGEDYSYPSSNGRRGYGRGNRR